MKEKEPAETPIFHISVLLVSIVGIVVSLVEFIRSIKHEGFFNQHGMMALVFMAILCYCLHAIGRGGEFKDSK